MAERSIVMETFEAAERLIAEGRLAKAVSMLKEVARTPENNARLAFDLGVASVKLGMPEEADRFLAAALKEGFQVSETLIWLGRAYEQMNMQAEAEEMYLGALKETDSDAFRPISILCQYYYEQEMYLKAKQYAAQAQAQAPDQYFGLHMQAQICLRRDQVQEAQALLLQAEDRFGGEGMYWMDRIAALEKQGKYLEALKLLEAEPRIEEVMPEQKLNLRLRMLTMRMRYAEARRVLEEMFTRFGSLDAAFFNMLFCIGEENYQEAEALALTILQIEETNKGALYYLALLMQVIIFFLASEGKQSAEAQANMKKDAVVCVNWFKRVGLPTGELEKALEDMFAKMETR